VNQLLGRATAPTVEGDSVKLRPDVMLLPLDGEYVLFSEKTQCLIGINATTALIVRKLQSGTPAAELSRALVSEGLAESEDVEHWVASSLNAIASCGLMSDRVLPTAEPGSPPAEGPRPRSRISMMPSYKPFPPAAERRYRLLATCALMRFAMVEQAERVDAAIGHLATEEQDEPSVTFDISGTVIGSRGSVRSYIYRDGEPLDFATGLLRLAPSLKSMLWSAAVNAYDFLFYFHAGVVGTGESCILLPAAAGSGKSSLTAALTRRGFHYFSDEVALINQQTFHVPAVPLAICVKRSGLGVIERYYPEVRTLMEHHRYDGRWVRYIAPPAAALKQTPAPVSHIIFPRFDRDAATELKPIARTEALGRLMGECLALRMRWDEKTVREVLRWISGIDCYTLTFSSLDEVVALVEGLRSRASHTGRNPALF
jgi:hypothetical protein